MPSQAKSAGRSWGISCSVFGSSQERYRCDRFLHVSRTYPNLAARLQGLATPDTVVLSAATFRLVQGYFTYQDLGAHPLKGVAAPVHAYRMLGESGVQSRLETVVPSRLTPLVGREEEVALLQHAGSRRRRGRGRWCSSAVRR